MPSLALQLIAQNKSSRATSLDLGNCGLDRIPAEAGHLVWLKHLSLASEWLEWDGKTWQVKQSSNAGPANSVSDLAPLAKLTGLQALYLSNTQVRDLAPLAKLTALQTLDFSRTEVRDLAPLAQFTALQRLDFSETQVRDLAPLADLLRGGIPVKWSSISWEGNGIHVKDCPLTNPPPEIAAQGNEAILNYFAERAKGGVDHLYEAKMLILGEGGAGKTSLVRRLYQPGKPLPTEKETTRGIAIHKHEFQMPNGRTFRLNVWDFGGQEIYHATHQFFLTHRSLYVLVDDTKKDHKSVSDEGFKYWLELIEVFGGHSPTLIFQNEKGGRSKAIDFGGIQQRYDNVKGLYAGDLDRSNAADKVRDGIKFFAEHLSLVGEEVPARWIKVREEIEALAKKTAYIPVEKYFEIYSEQIENDEIKALLLSRYLHDLGVFLHFQDDPLLGRKVILQNEWATNAAFRILDDEAIKKEGGRFNEEDCARLWKDSQYARMHPELLALMQNFELCYVLRDVQPTTWLAPQLLPPAKPEGLGNWAKPGDLVLRYRYEFLPKGILSRLTVRMHRYVSDPAKAWTTGVLFERDHTAVLAEILPQGSAIELRARGPEHKALLSVIAADLDALNESFTGLRGKVEKLIPCHCKVCLTSSTPTFFEQKDLLRRKELGVPKVQCSENCYRDVDVMELLDGIKMENPPDWATDDGDKPMRILFLAANPPQTARLDLEDELRSLKQELRGVKFRDAIFLIAEHAVHPDDLIRHVREHRPNVIHFSGHGSAAGMLLRSDKGSHQPVEGVALKRFLAGRGVDLVVLNSCHSRAQAEAIHSVVKTVVGTTDTVDDEAARRFTVAFYRSLGNGLSVGEAFRDGVDAATLHGLSDVFQSGGDLDLTLVGKTAKPARFGKG